MDYLLANELKNAGFPQGGRGRWIVDPNRIVVRSEDRAYVPTLEELIEACGAAFHSVGRVSYAPFLARGPIVQATGQTPIEAVARLWLALQAAKPK